MLVDFAAAVFLGQKRCGALLAAPLHLFGELNFEGRLD
jgi:hypothetical protein